MTSSSGSTAARSSSALLLDTAIFLYAAGGAHRYQEACRSIVARLGAGTLRGSASVALVQEYVHARGRRREGRRAALAEATEISNLVDLRPFRGSDVPTLLALLGAHPRLDAQDAVHAATAINNGIGAILSTDRAFDDVGGLERVDPLDTERVEALMSS